MAAQEPSTAFSFEPYSYGEARAVAESLGLSEPVAVTLVRRGYRTPQAAAEFLAGEEEHEPGRFDSIARIVSRLLAAARDGTRVTVHGDYDVDGVCSTAILVETLRELGASCDWIIPDRASDGYGLTASTVEALAGRGTGLIVTADCGIGSAEEVASARRLGIETIVTDHHQPPEVLPDCPILHPAVSGYPFEQLCATAVAHKLSAALRAEAGLEEERRELELVALATVADMVPLVGENRRLVREGVAAIRRGARPGLRALMAVSKTDPATIDAGDLGFRIAPRINAAGRLYRADAGVELMLTQDPDRAAEIATELDRANHERRTVERETLAAAERELAAQDPEAPAIVLAGEGWHPGVIGIVASRLAQRYWRPVVLIGLEGRIGRGSGRSIPGFNLVEALSSCAEHLVRFGGHAAAAGVSIESGAVSAFREALVKCAAETIKPSDMVRRERIDAVVGVGVPVAGGIGIGLAEELERLAPFGSANPKPRLLIPAARMHERKPMGESGAHARFQIESGTGRVAGVAFNVGSGLEDLDGGRADLAVSLEVDRWNGAVQPRVVLESAVRRPVAEMPLSEEQPGDESWWSRLEAELEAPLAAWPQETPWTGGERAPVDRRGGATVAAIAELLSSGGSVVAVCADARRRAALPRLVPGAELADWATLVRDPGDARDRDHVVMLEPAPFAAFERIAFQGDGYLHLAWGEPEIELAERLLDHEWDLRAHIAEIYRGLRQEGLEGERLAAAIAGPGRYPRSPELAGRCLRVLLELGLVSWDGAGHGRRLRVVSSEGTELDRSRAYLAYRARHEEGKQYLRRHRQERLPAAA